jgi:hypothetical protein
VPADAHPIDQFRACTAFTATARRCVNSGEIVAVAGGGKVDLRARVVPAHAGQLANLTRRRPHNDQWVRFATVRIGPHGRMHYLWQTTVSDVRPLPGERVYFYQFRIPGHGVRSDLLGVDVRHSVE